MKEKIETLEMGDGMAEKAIIEFINIKKAEGNAEIDIIDIADSTKLPFSQINKIMKKLESRGISVVSQK